MNGGFTVCVLGFADHVEELDRCLGSIVDHLPSMAVAEVRIGLNAPSARLRSLADGHAAAMRAPRVSVLESDGAPKYPTMRRLFYGEPITTSFVMWFDDDSFLFPAGHPKYAPGFFGDCGAIAAASHRGDGVDAIGWRYTQDLTGDQVEWIGRQPWYTGRPLGRNPKTGAPSAAFLQGAWWAARWSLLAELDYPWPHLHHNGGDVMLGVLAAQQRWQVFLHRDGVAINADAAGNESQGKRRGLNTYPTGHARSGEPRP